MKNPTGFNCGSMSLYPTAFFPIGEGRGGKIKSMDKKITFGADRVMVRGPRASDGALTVVIETGEYQREQVAEVVRIPPNTPVKVTIEYEE